MTAVAHIAYTEKNIGCPACDRVSDKDNLEQIPPGCSFAFIAGLQCRLSTFYKQIIILLPVCTAFNATTGCLRSSGFTVQSEAAASLCTVS